MSVFFDFAHTLHVLSMNRVLNRVHQIVVVTPALVQRAYMLQSYAHVLAGNALNVEVFPNQAHLLTASQNAPAQNDEFTHGFVLSAGTYTFEGLALLEASGGIVDWYLDDTLIGSNDLYSASLTYNHLFSVVSVVVATDGWHVLRGKVATKNASSLNYRARLTSYWLRPGSD